MIASVNISVAGVAAHSARDWVERCWPWASGLTWISLIAAVPALAATVAAIGLRNGHPPTRRPRARRQRVYVWHC